MANHIQAGSREKMLETAILLMRRTGLSGAGINEVIRASGTPKGSMYYHFPGGKQQLVRDALALYAGRARVFLDEALSGPEKPAAKIRALFDALARRVEDANFEASCAAGTVSLDLDAELEPLRISVAAAFSVWIATIAAHFPSPNARAADSFAGLVLSTIEGAYIRSRAAQSAEPFREAGRWLSALAAATFGK